MGSICQEKSLGISAIVPGTADTVIHGAHSSEMERPGRWFAPGSVMLTTGLGFIGHERDSRHARLLLDDLAQAGVEALFFGVEVHFDAVPTGLIAAARAMKFPLYSVAAEVPFYYIENFVNQSRISSEAYLLKRAAWVTNNLMETISAEDPVGALVGGLALACRGTAVLYGASGSIIAATGEGPTRLLWTEYQISKGTRRQFTVGRWHAVGSTMILRGDIYNLVLAGRNETVLKEIGDLLLDTAQRLFGAINGITQLALSRDRHENSQLLTALQDGIPASREYRYWQQLKAFNFAEFQPLRALVMTAQNSGPFGGAILESLLREAFLTGMGLLLAESRSSVTQPDSLHALVPESHAVDAWLKLAGENLVVGVSESVAELGLIPDAFREAETAWRIARRRKNAALQGTGCNPLVVRLDDVDLSTWLLAKREGPQIDQRIRKYALALQSEADLYETVIAYLASDLDIVRTATHLYLHPNTIRYRLRKAEKILGQPIAASATITNLFLAFQEDVLGLRERLPTPVN